MKILEMKNTTDGVKYSINEPKNKIDRAEEQINLKKELRDFCRTSCKNTKI